MPRTLEPPPLTTREPVTDILHGVEITDPYRWLENQDSSATRCWIKKQTNYARAYFDSISGREAIRLRVAELLSVPSVSDPWKVDSRYFFLKRDQNREQPSIVMREGLFGNDITLVDPTLRRAGSSTAVAIAGISHDAHLLAYSVRHGGTDHSAIEVLDIDRHTALPDGLPDGFGSGFAFAMDGSGFYYSHRALSDPRPNYRAVFRHSFGTNQSEDQEVFFAGEERTLFVWILCSPEAQLLAYVSFHTGKHPRTSLHLHSMKLGSVPKLLLHEIEGSFVPFFAQGQLFAFTDYSAPNFRIVRIDTENPDPINWRDVVPEWSGRIQQFAVARNSIFVTRTDRFSTQVEAFSTDGIRQDGLSFSECGSVDLLSQPTPTDKLFYCHTSISQPASLHCYDQDDHTNVTPHEPIIAIDPAATAVEEVSYTSRDGTVVPLLIAARKDLLHRHSMPTFLTGYGGFGTCVTPRFTAFAAFLIERGFLFAVPALRGGSELGEQWHLAGKRAGRQNSFDDFIAAAEWLVSTGLSDPGRIAVGGGSNAGLLVGAAITQRPDLFSAAICLGPLLDMTRYHLFDFAAGWADEYGSPEDEQDFHSLLSYSPYHHVEDGTAYPATLLISGDADSRCNPMHARKMAARLQAASTSLRPILLDYKSEWGHMPVQPLSRKIEALTDRLAFICHELGVPLQGDMGAPNAVS